MMEAKILKTLVIVAVVFSCIVLVGLLVVLGRPVTGAWSPQDINHTPVQMTGEYVKCGPGL